MSLSNARFAELAAQVARSGAAWAESAAGGAALVPKGSVAPVTVEKFCREIEAKLALARREAMP